MFIQITVGSITTLPTFATCTLSQLELGQKSVRPQTVKNKNKKKMKGNCLIFVPFEDIILLTVLYVSSI